MSEPTPINKKKNFFSEWLEQLQQESWQLELLISGLALFGIFESRSLIRRFSYYLDVNWVSDYAFYYKAIELLMWAGWIIFLVNLLIHIIIRGLWIGAIGLRYVSGDIDFDTLNYSEVFSSYLKRKIGSFDDYIERLEKLSSVLFSFTFLLFFMFLSFVVVNLVFALTVRILESLGGDTDTTSAALGFFGMAFYGIGFLVLIDFISLGAFKKVKDKSFATVYLWIYRFYSAISLSFIYRPLLLNFIDDKYTRRLFFLAIPYTLMILVGFRGLDVESHSYIPTFSARYNYHEVVSENSINWLYYDDLREQHTLTFADGDELPIKHKITKFSLSNYKVEGDFLELFVEYRDQDNKKLEEKGLSPFRKRGFKHDLFAKGKVDQPVIDKIDSLYIIEYRHIKEIIVNGKEVDTMEFSPFKEHIKHWKTFPKEKVNDARDELKIRYDKLKDIAMNEHLQNIKKEVLQHYVYKIDGLEADFISSHFYTHPNLHERGILSYLSIKDLLPGPHEISFYWSEKDDHITTIPFFKL